MTRWRRPERHVPLGRFELVAVVRQRLGLGSDRDAELDLVLVDAPVVTADVAHPGLPGRILPG